MDQAATRGLAQPADLGRRVSVPAGPRGRDPLATGGHERVRLHGIQGLQRLGERGRDFRHDTGRYAIGPVTSRPG